MNRDRFSCVEDFVCDAYFIKWVFHPKPDIDAFWQNWLSEHKEKAVLAERAREVLLSIQIRPSSKSLSAMQVDEMSRCFLEQTHSRRVLLRKWPWIGTAAAVLILALGMWYWQTFNMPSAQPVIAHATKWNTIINNGKSSRLARLSDKSLVLLRPQSTLNYPDRFGYGNREVFLIGEAFFEVSPDRQHPFLVKTGALLTRVLGTSFDVIAPRDGLAGSVIVKTGKVQVYRMRKNALKKTVVDSIILMPNQKAVYSFQAPKLEIISVKPVMLSPVEADKYFSFTNAPVVEVIDRLQKAYHIEITYDKQKFKNINLTASLSRLSLEAKIHAICKAIDVKYKFEENKIRIYEQPPIY